MSDLMALYRYTPVWLQNLAVTQAGRRIVHERFNEDYDRILAAAEARLAAGHEALVRFRDERLHTFVQHCARTVPFYRDLFADQGIDPAGIHGLDDLSHLPILTKADIQPIAQQFRSISWRNRPTIPRQTSGSTGTPLDFVITMEALREQWAVWWRYWRWHGIQPGTWSGCLTGHFVVPTGQRRPPFWRIDGARKQILFSNWHLSAENAPFYVAELRRRRPPWLQGYPSLLTSLASFIREQDLDLGYQPRWITTGSETLLPEQRQLLREVFGVYPRQHFGMAEGIANLSECEHGNLHLDEDFAPVEFLPNPHGEGLRIVGSNVSNLAACFLRYDSNDLVDQVSEEPCPCGRPGRIVQTIDGRAEDYVILSDGSRVGRINSICRHLHCLREIQIHQDRPGIMEVWVVRSNSYREGDDQAILRAIHKRVGDLAQVSLVFKDALPRSTNGKLRLVVSTIPAGQLTTVAGTQPPDGEADDDLAR